MSDSASSASSDLSPTALPLPSATGNNVGQALPSQIHVCRLESLDLDDDSTQHEVAEDVVRYLDQLFDLASGDVAASVTAFLREETHSPLRIFAATSWIQAKV